MAQVSAPSEPALPLSRSCSLCLDGGNGSTTHQRSSSLPTPAPRCAFQVPDGTERQRAFERLRVGQTIKFHDEDGLRMGLVKTCPSAGAVKVHPFLLQAFLSWMQLRNAEVRTEEGTLLVCKAHQSRQEDVVQLPVPAAARC